jgi:hypothetical protein
MGRLVKRTRLNRRLPALLAAGLFALFAGFRYAVSLDEGTSMHIKKQLREASRMPGRLLT